MKWFRTGILLGVFLASGFSHVRAADSPSVFQGKEVLSTAENMVRPSLLKPEDLRKSGTEKARKAKKGRLDHEELSFTQDELTRRILESYNFLGDFEEEDAPKVPAKWLKISDSPVEALALGEPPKLQRHSSVLELPWFRLRVLHHFSGNEAQVFHLNTAIDFWRQALLSAPGEARNELLQEASNAFVGFERIALGMTDDDEETAAKQKTKKKERGKVEGPAAEMSNSVGWALRGFFYLQVLADRDVIAGREDEGMSAKDKLSPKSLGVMARISFQRAMEPFSPAKLLPQFDKNSLDGQLLSTVFDCPYYDEDGLLTVAPAKPKTCEISVTNGFIEPAKWLRSVAIPVYWNLVVSQRTKGYWEKAFDAGDLLAAYSARLPEEFKKRFRWPAYSDGVGPVIPVSQPVISSPVRLWPRRLADLEASGFLMQSYYSFLQNDPLEVLKTAARGIRKSDTPELAGLGLHLASLAYYDLKSFRHARQAAAWCEGVSGTFASKVPACVLFGAESAFWQGDMETAERGFLRFQSISGDSDYGPWVEYRLINIRHLRAIQRKANGPPANASDVEREIFVDYDSLMRRYSSHAVAPYAAVRAFCSGTAHGFLNGEAMRKADADLRERMTLFVKKRNEASARRLSRELGEREFTHAEIKAGWEPAEVSLPRDAEACLLSSSLGMIYEKSGADRRSIRSEADVQMKAIDTYRSAFPDSPYLEMFAPRYRALNLAKVIDLADTNRCEELLQSYQQSGGSLNALHDEGKLYLRTLFWGEEERKIVARCAALKGERQTWRELREMYIPRDSKGKRIRGAKPRNQDGGAIEELLFEFTIAKDRRKPALSLSNELLKTLDAQSWEKAIADVEKSGNGYVRNDEFWKGMALRSLLEFELTGSTSDVEQFRRKLLANLLHASAQILKSEVLCLWTVRESSSFDRHAWDELAQAQAGEEWQKLIFADRVKRPEQCRKSLADSLLRASMNKPSEMRDSLVLIPYLEKKGMKDGGDEWLGYAQRVATVRGVHDKRVRELYQRLLREGPPLVKQAAKAWLENHAPVN